MKKALVVTTLATALMLICVTSGCSPFGKGSPAKSDNKTATITKKDAARKGGPVKLDATTSAAPVAPSASAAPSGTAAQVAAAAPAAREPKPAPAAAAAPEAKQPDATAKPDAAAAAPAPPQPAEPAAPAEPAVPPADDGAEKTVDVPAAEVPEAPADAAAEPKAAEVKLAPDAAAAEEPKTAPPSSAQKGGGTVKPEEKLKKLDAVSGADIAEREAVADTYMRAQGHYYDGNLQAARTLLKTIYKGQPYYDMAQRFLKVVEVDIAKAEREQDIEEQEAGFHDAQVQRLYREADRKYNERRYAEAADKIEQAYKLDTNNEKVRRLRADALMARGNADLDINGLNQDARMSEVLANIEKIATPPPNTKAQRPVPQETPEPDAEAQRLLEEKLNQRVDINLEATPLDYLLNILYRGTGVNIIAKPEDLEGKTLTLHVEGIKLIDLLDYISKTLGVSFTCSRNAIWLQGGGEAQSGPLMDWRVIPLNKGLIDVANEKNSTTSDLEKALEKLADLIDWPQGSQWYLDRMTNSLIVRTTSESMEQFTRLVRALDVTPVQVLIETKFIQLSSKDFSDLGIDWKLTSDLALAKKDGQNSVQVDSGMGVKLPTPVPAGSDFDDTSGFSAIVAGVMTVPQFQMMLHAIKASGRSSDLGGPQVIAVNNGLATIEVTQDDFFVKDYQIDRQDFSGSTFSNSTYPTGTVNLPGASTTNTNLDWAAPVIKPVYDKVETGFKLKVSPSVGRDLKDITLYLEPEINDLVNTLKTPIASTVVTGTPLQVEQPIVAKRKLSVKCVVADGYVVAMGGLVKQTKERGMVKVPLLGDIPLLGALFRHENEKNVKYNLLIFVTARILTSEGRTYVDAGPEGEPFRNGAALGAAAAADGGGPAAERARDLRDRVEVQVLQ